MDKKIILIIGGGFGGVACALTLAKHNHLPAKVTLVSDKPHLEYTPGLYRVVVGHPPLETCIPLSEIFSGKNIMCVTDTIISVNLLEKKALGSSGDFYQFDYVVLGIGSQTAYFNIPGLADFSFGFKSITEAIRLNRHILKLFNECKAPHASADAKMHFVVVGAGASGVELAGELAFYTHKLAKRYNIPSSLITIDLIEAASRILSSFPESVSLKIKKRLHKLGVNIFTHRPIQRAEVQELHLKGLTMKSDTVIWTAGIEPNELFAKIAGLTFDNKGKVLVDEYLRARSFKNVFTIGDGAATPYSGMAQTAIREGVVVAQNIISTLADSPLVLYQAKQPYYSLPVGPGWAATLIGSVTIYGKIGWLLRKLADLRYFISILSPAKAIVAFRSGKALCRSCKICAPEQTTQV